MSSEKANRVINQNNPIIITDMKKKESYFTESGLERNSEGRRMKSSKRIDRIKSMYLYIPPLLILLIVLFGNNIHMFRIYKFFTLFIFGAIWVLWVSFGSILINRYLFIEVPPYEKYQGKVREKTHPWFKWHWSLQLLDIVANLSLIIILFVILQYVFKNIFLLGEDSKYNGKIGTSFLKLMTKFYLLLTSGKFSLCRRRNQEECNNTFFCDYSNNQCSRTDNDFLRDYSQYVVSNINILNAFLTVYFQTSIRNKLDYFIKKYLSNKDNFLFVPHFG